MRIRIEWYEKNVDPDGFLTEKLCQWDTDRINSSLPRLEISPYFNRASVKLQLEVQLEQEK